MKTFLSGLVATVLLACGISAHAEKVALIKVHGTINPATAGYIARSINEVTEDRAQCLILQLDTPGGLLDSTKDIVQSFFRSGVPVVVYVAPSGANATSAGCFITLASDVAAMAPNTSIGAAHSVAIGGGGAEKVDDVMKQKLENFTVSYIENIAEKRGRNVEWAKSAVRESANITAEKALTTKVIEIIATDLPDLLKQLDGRTIKERVLKTAGAEVREIPMSTREQVFQMVWRPEVLMILMLIAVYGIIGEISNPGGIIPGVVGVVALILALYMSAALPVDIAGIALIVLAVGLFIAEAERERRARIINAEAEFQAAEKLVQAAALISDQPIALQLRFLQTMKEISGENNTTTLLPLPMDLFTPFLKRAVVGGTKSA